MILGILSDTHGQAERTGEAVRVLRAAGAEALVHCGDLGSPAVLDELVVLPTWAVLGNTDGLNHGLIRYAEALGIRVADAAPLCIEVGGCRLAVFHGHEPEFGRLFEGLSGGGAWRESLASCRYILHGHSHTPCDGQLGPWRVINPGALHRATVHTVATLDLEADAVRHWRVSDDAAASGALRLYELEF
jgi:putative phosphoesterase